MHIEVGRGEPLPAPENQGGGERFAEKGLEGPKPFLCDLYIIGGES